MWWFSNTDLSLYLLANLVWAFTSKTFVVAVWSISWHKPENTKANFIAGGKISAIFSFRQTSRQPWDTVKACEKLWNGFSLWLYLKLTTVMKFWNCSNGIGWVSIYEQIFNKVHAIWVLTSFYSSKTLKLAFSILLIKLLSSLNVSILGL